MIALKCIIDNIKIIKGSYLWVNFGSSFSGFSIFGFFSTTVFGISEQYSSIASSPASVKSVNLFEASSPVFLKFFYYNCNVTVRLTPIFSSCLYI